MPTPTKPTTPAEYRVLGCFLMIVLNLGGLTLLFLGFTATEEKAELAAQAIKPGWAALLLSAICMLVAKGIRYLLR